MCGIFCFISRNHSVEFGQSVLKECQCLLNNRGPNSAEQLIYDRRVLMYGSVLWQQGAEITHQPIVSDRFALLFNGDLFIERANLRESDTRWLFDKIETMATNIDNFGQLFKQLKGPFSLVLLDKQLQRVYFARDSIGRNSLLIGYSDTGIFISSVMTNQCEIDVAELPPNGIYYVNLVEHQLNLLPWNDDRDIEIGSLNINESFLKLPWFNKNSVQPTFNYHHILKDYTASGIESFEYLLNIPAISNVCDHLLEVLSQSIHERIRNTPEYCKHCVGLQTACGHAKVGILFSGGIDCTIIALLADRFIPADLPICLLNVAFEKVIRPENRKLKKTMECSQATEINWDVPDRVTGRNTYNELRQIRPQREWHFVEINVTRKELDSHKERISNLVYPLQSVLDESLGAALWFASRGKGKHNDIEYDSTCRVLLLGSGADELFGGYSRHRVAFFRDIKSMDKGPTDSEIDAAYENLRTELDKDWQRLPSRNLARDDRIIGDHGVTPRTPYLQEEFISIVQSLNAAQRCYHPLGEGTGDKLTLRLCGFSLGLTSSARLRKRALQFGSRIADRKQNANDKSSFLVS